MTGRKALFGAWDTGIGIVGMPDAEARPLLRSFAEHATAPRFVYRHAYRVPVVFVSAAEDVPRRNDLQNLGAAACIQKPIGPRDLVTRIRAVMNRRNGTVAVV